MVSTRSASNSPVKKSSSPSKITVVSNPSSLRQGQSLKIVVAPKDVTEDARLLLLKHPRHLTPKRFLFCPKSGLFEFTKIAAPSLDHRSVLFSSSQTSQPSTSGVISSGYVNKSAEYVTATPFDICFLLIRGLATGKNQFFQPLDDLLEELEAEDKHFTYIVRHGRCIVEAALSRICDTVSAGDEQMYRYNGEKVLKLLLSKAEAAIPQGLPSSLEERFVTRSMETPVLSVKREESSISLVNNENRVDTPETSGESFDSQSTAESSATPTIFSETSSASTTVTVCEEPDTIPTEVCRLQRIRTVFNFISSSYIQPDIATKIQTDLENNTTLGINWDPLTKHVERIAELRAEALASRSLNDFGRKRGNLEDDEEAEARAEKKRRSEEDEKKRKANLSRGVRELGKVNVTGMKKMSAFFAKKPATAKAKT